MLFRSDSGSGARDTARLAVQAKAPYAVPLRASAGDPGDAAFTIGTFNVLGSQHTTGRRDNFRSGVKRAKVAARLIKAKGIDVIGLQEVQDDQLKVLRRDLPDYQVWPRKKIGRSGVRLQIAWRRSEFELVKGDWLNTPFDRMVRPMPYVELRHRGTQRTVYVIDTHNSPRGLEKERDEATAQQLALINQLRAGKQAVFFLGDMNEKREIFCQVVSKTSLRAANGGAAASKRDCTLPEGRLHIDWIFGAGPFAFTGYEWFDGADVRKASDHSLIRAQVSVRPRSG